MYWSMNAYIDNTILASSRGDTVSSVRGSPLFEWV